MASLLKKHHPTCGPTFVFISAKQKSVFCFSCDRQIDGLGSTCVDLTSLHSIGEYNGEMNGANCFNDEHENCVTYKFRLDKADAFGFWHLCCCDLMGEFWAFKADDLPQTAGDIIDVLCKEFKGNQIIPIILMKFWLMELNSIDQQDPIPSILRSRLASLLEKIPPSADPEFEGLKKDFIRHN